MEQIYAVDYFDFRISLILTWGCHAEALEVWRAKASTHDTSTGSASA